MEELQQQWAEENQTSLSTLSSLVNSLVKQTYLDTLKQNGVFVSDTDVIERSTRKLFEEREVYFTALETSLQQLVAL
jgi:predicted transcriptional regulator